MKSCFRLLLRVIAALFGIVWIALAAILLLLINSESILLSSSTYTRALGHERIDERLPALVVDTILAQAPKTWEEGNLLPSADNIAKSCAYQALGPAAFRTIYDGDRNPSPDEIASLKNCGIGTPGQKQSIGGLDPDKMVSLLQLLLTPEWQQSMADSFLQQAFRIINTPGEPYSIVLSLKELKANASGSVMAAAVIKTYFDTYPACDSWDNPLPPEGPTSGPTSPLLAPAANYSGTCHVPENIYQQYKSQFDELQAEFQATGLINNQPDQMDILESWRGSDSFASMQSLFPIDWRYYLQDLGWVNRLGLIPCVVLLFLILFLAVRSWRDFFLWLGALLLATGLVLSIAGFLLLLAAHVGIYLWIRDAAPAYLPLIQAGGGVLGAVARNEGLVTIGEGFLLTFLGLGLTLPTVNRRPRTEV
jgi:hypothetical protein